MSLLNHEEDVSSLAYLSYYKINRTSSNLEFAACFLLYQFSGVGPLSSLHSSVVFLQHRLNMLELKGICWQKLTAISL